MRAGLLTALLFVPLAAQASESAEERAAKIERYIERAREGSPVVRPQAAARLVALGQPAAKRLRELAGTSAEQLARLGPDLVEALGQFGHEDLRQRLWGVVQDRSFPWRPAATRGAVYAARADEAWLFLPLLEDPLSAVQLAAFPAIAKLDPDDVDRVRPILRRLLASPVGAVRRAAAVEMDRLGDPWALAYLIEELGREDEFFGVPTGRQARADALRSLAARLGGTQGYDVALAPDAEVNRVAVGVFRERVRQLLGGRELPEVPPESRAAGPTPGDRIGLELRSCRLGEFRLRWNASDVLYVGEGRAAELALPSGSVQALVDALGESLGTLGEKRFFGKPGCDHEQLLWRGDPTQRAESFQVSKGPDPEPELRPPALQAALRRLLDSLPNEPALTTGDERTAYLRHRVCAAFAEVGGPIAACAAVLPCEQRPLGEVPKSSGGAWMQAPGERYDSTVLEILTERKDGGALAIDVSSITGSPERRYLPKFRLRREGDGWAVDVQCRWSTPRSGNGALEVVGGEVTLYADGFERGQHAVLVFELDGLRAGRVEHLRGSLPAYF